MVAATWRIETVGRHHLEQLRIAGEPTICALWHGSLLAPLWEHRGEQTTILIGHHRDAQRLAKSAARWGYQVIRGSSTRGAVSGLTSVLRVLQAGGEVALAPDGPRGPARVPTPGAVAAAQRTGAAIVAVGVAASPCWTLSTWDRFMLPCPFARIRIVYDEPFRVSAGREQRAVGVRRLSERLEAVTEAARCA